MEEQQKKQLESYRQLVEKHSGKLLQFAIQNGYSIEMSNQLVENAFSQFFNSENQIGDQSVWLLYHYVIAEINSRLPDDQLTDQLFSFEEDHELHQIIVQLNSETKLPFILSKFHGLNHDEISKILGLSQNDINSAIEKVNRSLSGKMNAPIIDKRIGFLRKSYERIKTNFEVENIFQLPLEASTENRMPKINIPKKTIFYWAASIVAFLTLSIVLIMNSAWYQRASAEKYIQNLEESFERTLSAKLTEIGIGELTNEEQEEYSFTFIYKARESFNELNKKIEQQRDVNQQISKKDVEREYNEVLLTLQTPSEMAELLFKEPLANNKEQSEEFITRFYEQYLAVQELYQVKLRKYTVHIDKKNVNEHGVINDQFNIDDFLATSDNLPEEFVLLIKGMDKQNFNFFSIPNWAAVYPRLHRNDFSEKLRNSLHEDVGGYLTLIEFEPFHLYPNFAYSIEETIEFIKEFEETLLTTNPNSKYRIYLRNMYIELLYEITIGSMPGKLYNKLGVLRNEYQEAWKQIASFGDNSPSAYIMREVISEKEEGNWKKPMIQTQLDINVFNRALELAISGDLNGIILEEDKGFGRVIATFNDLDFIMTVDELYKKFSVNHDPSILEQLSPLEIVAIYDYANELKDPVTMWHLFDHDNIPYSLEEYVDIWQQHIPIHEQADLIYAENYGEEIDGSLIITIGYQEENATTYFARMKENTESSTWLFYEVP